MRKGVTGTPAQSEKNKRQLELDTKHPEKGIDLNNKTCFVEYILVVLRKIFSWRKNTVLLRGEKKILLALLQYFNKIS